MINTPEPVFWLEENLFLLPFFNSLLLLFFRFLLFGCIFLFFISSVEEENTTVVSSDNRQKKNAHTTCSKNLLFNSIINAAKILWKGYDMSSFVRHDWREKHFSLMLTFSWENVGKLQGNFPNSGKIIYSNL